MTDKQIKSLFQYIAIYAVYLVMTYLACAFVQVEINAFEWKEGLRGIYVFSALTGAFLSILVVMGINDNE